MGYSTGYRHIQKERPLDKNLNKVLVKVQVHVRTKMKKEKKPKANKVTGSVAILLTGI